MAECIIIGNGGGSAELEFDMTGITHYYDETTIDVSNNLWIDSVSGNNIDVSDCVINSDNIEMSVNTTKDISVPIRPVVLYCVLKKEAGEDDTVVFGVKVGFSNNDLVLWNGNDAIYKNNNFMVSCNGSPYLFPQEAISYGDYHVFAMYNYATGFGGGTPIAGTYFDNKVGQSRSCGISQYYQAVRLNSGISPTYFKMIAIGHEETDVSVIANNCKYLCKKYNIGE